MFLVETYRFKPVIERVIIPSIGNIPRDTQSVLQSSKSKPTEFRLKNKERLEKELRFEEMRKLYKRIKRTTRYFDYLKEKIEDLEKSRPGFKVIELHQQLEKAEEPLEIPEVDR